MNDKRITKTGSTIIIILQAIMFTMTWYADYNDKAFRTNRLLGMVCCVVIWLIIFLWLCEVYGAFSIASTAVGETVFSQFISFGIADLTLYIVCVLLHRNYVDIWPGVGCVLVQLGVATLGVIGTKRQLMKRIVPAKTVIIYGGDYDRSKVDIFVEQLLRKYNHLFNITGIVREDPDLGKLCQLIDQYEKVMLLSVTFEVRKQVTRYCIEHKKIFFFVPELDEIIYQNCETKHLIDTPLKRYNINKTRLEYRLTKRLLDILFSLIFIVLFSPIMLVIAVAIKLEDRGPALFIQKRITKDERPFDIYKFRSMVVDADNTEKYGVRPTVDNDPRITRVGRFIRACRMDELPQLFNILKGDMAFVGPRPERVEHVEKYEAELPEFRYRHSVKGGLTGYAQVYGQYNTSPEDKLKLDLLYIMNQSFFMDAKIIMLTFKTLFQKESTEGFSDVQARCMNEMIQEIVVK